MAHEQHAPQRFPPPRPGLDGSKGIALYAQLADILRHQVLSGAWPEGHRLETFEQLAARYVVARITVRQAVARLVKEGLLTASRGRGTFVLARSREPLALGGDVAIRILFKSSATELPPEFRGSFETFERYLELTKLHIVRDIPFGMIRIYVADEAVRRFPRGAITKQKVLRMTMSHAPEIAEQLRQRMTVELADGLLSQHLQIPLGAPVVKIVRQTFGPDRKLSYAGISWYRGDVFDMDIELPRTLIEDSSQALIAPGVRRSF